MSKWINELDIRDALDIQEIANRTSRNVYHNLLNNDYTDIKRMEKYNFSIINVVPTYFGNWCNVFWYYIDNDSCFFNKNTINISRLDREDFLDIFSDETEINDKFVKNLYKVLRENLKGKLEGNELIRLLYED